MVTTLTPAAPLDGEAILPLSAAKAHLRVTTDDEDDLIRALRDAAIDWVERHTSKSLAPREWVWASGRFASALRLTMEPVTSVLGITYRGDAGDVSLAPGSWALAGAAVRPAGTWPSLAGGEDAVRVTFTAGYADVAKQAPALIAAVQLLLGHLHTNRSVVITGTIATEIPFAVETLCAPYRPAVLA